jgi:hypothetical protein
MVSKFKASGEPTNRLFRIGNLPALEQHAIPDKAACPVKLSGRDTFSSKDPCAKQILAIHHAATIAAPNRARISSVFFHPSFSLL